MQGLLKVLALLITAVVVGVCGGSVGVILLNMANTATVVLGYVVFLSTLVSVAICIMEIIMIFKADAKKNKEVEHVD